MHLWQHTYGEDPFLASTLVKSHVSGSRGVDAGGFIRMPVVCDGFSVNSQSMKKDENIWSRVRYLRIVELLKMSSLNLSVVNANFFHLRVFLFCWKG